MKKSNRDITLADRRAFMCLPMKQRREIMECGANELSEYYNSCNGWKLGEDLEVIEKTQEESHD